MSTEKHTKLTAGDIWDGKSMVGPDPNSLMYNSVLGIGLSSSATEGWLITGIFQIDCSPIVTEFKTLDYERDIYFGWSSVEWQIRTSADGIHWSPWYNTVKDAPVKQFVQFKFILSRTGVPY